ncbi:hypothetical protein [Streptomyces yaizuensis]|uniref:DUF5753 domain-containing protein n=1 Tax=Streptomyces yaizuensis TaxID=2989713 RepID=A0ABQ5P4C5_9ACTN|nr:hypothetical protein [Streptomyces sp. YSPA8]GLF97313.1 hypothetical protein SYYSPA8_23470 [Streptomyces sp. YSPA8]
MTLHVETAPDGSFELRMVKLYNCVVPEVRIVVPRVALTVFVNDVRAGVFDHLLASDDEMAAARELVSWSTSEDAAGQNACDGSGHDDADPCR